MLEHEQVLDGNLMNESRHPTRENASNILMLWIDFWSRVHIEELQTAQDFKRSTKPLDGELVFKAV